MSMTLPWFPEHPQFRYETLRQLGHAAYGGADIGEVFIAASRITPGDTESWYAEWAALAERVEAEARRAAGAHPVSARDAWLRASTYHRASEFFLHARPDDPRILAAHRSAVASFREAAALMRPAVQPVEVPFEGTTLPGYRYPASGSSGQGARPAVIMHTGFDGTAEEMHFFGAAAAAERGYEVLVVDGPGQGSALRERGLVFRPDWESVITPVLDWLLADPVIDPDRVALLGLSMGGELAPRAAAFEPRLAACIALDGVYDVAASTLPEGVDPDRARAALAAADPAEIDADLTRRMAQEPVLRWAVENGTYAFGVRTPREFIAALSQFHLRDGIAERISCPTLVCEAAADLFFPGQPQALYDHLTCPRTLLRLPDGFGAEAHCHSGAQRLAFAHVLDWLDDVLAERPVATMP